MLLGAAFILGVFSSLHCVGMCGPIALATPIIRKNVLTEIISRILYNMGRTSTYVLLGLLAGIVGSGFHWGGVQQWVSILSGSIILVWLIIPRTNPENWKIIRTHSLMGVIKNKIGYFFQHTNFLSIFLIGLLNGMLPCAMVFMAIAGAITSPSVIDGMLYMLFFGLGTWPLMLVLTSAWQLVTPKFKTASRKYIPYLIGLIGVLLIVRGLGLGIPYLSPDLSPASTAMTNCN